MLKKVKSLMRNASSYPLSNLWFQHETLKAYRKSPFKTFSAKVRLHVRSCDREVCLFCYVQIAIGDFYYAQLCAKFTVVLWENTGFHCCVAYFTPSPPINVKAWKQNFTGVRSVLKKLLCKVTKSYILCFSITFYFLVNSIFVLFFA